MTIVCKPQWKFSFQAVPGDIMMMSLHPSCNDLCMIHCRWSLNSTLIDLRADYRRRLSGGNLVIRNLDLAKDAGVYQCTAFNSLGAILSRRASLQFACEWLTLFTVNSEKLLNSYTCYFCTPLYFTPFRLFVTLQTWILKLKWEVPCQCVRAKE